MNKRIGSLCSLAILALVAGIISGATLLYAQGAPEQGGTAQQEQQPQPAQPPGQASQAPDPQAQSQPSDAQTFSGTIVKSGNKYVLQDTDSGNTYDIDRQDLAKQHEGK